MTDDIEIVIIELPKVEKYKKGLVLEQISQDETERHLAELRLKHIRDQKAIEAAEFDKGFEKIKKNFTSIFQKILR